MEKEVILHCASCGRLDTTGPEGTEVLIHQGQKWCKSCASLFQLQEGNFVINYPSPGKMISGQMIGPLDTWIDCYELKPKKRILVKKAKEEIQRAWSLWNKDKTSENDMFKFYAWLKINRPYFLTFRSKGDPWQKVHSWLNQYENKK